MSDYDDYDYDPDIDGRTLAEIEDPFLPDPSRNREFNSWLYDPLHEVKKHLYSLEPDC